jgi:hypothetical protein
MAQGSTPPQCGCRLHGRLRRNQWLAEGPEPAKHVSRHAPATSGQTAKVNKIPRTNDGTWVLDTRPRLPRRKLVTPSYVTWGCIMALAMTKGLCMECIAILNTSRGNKLCPANPRFEVRLQSELNLVVVVLNLVLQPRPIEMLWWRDLSSLFFLREGLSSQGASWVVCGSGVYIPPYEFLNLYGIFNSRFCISFSWETTRTKEPYQGMDEGWGAC